MPRLANAVAACLAAAGVAFSPTGAQAMTLADVLVNAPDTTPFSFETLIAALSAASLVDTFADPTSGPFTVFPPTDDAFAAALEALGITAEDLLADVDTLTTILTNHVIEGEVKSTDLSDGLVATSLAGFDLTFTLPEEGGAFVNGIEILAVDIMAKNGVAHVIDGVLLPPADEPGRGDRPTPRPTPRPTDSPTAPICPPCTCSPTNAPTEAPIAPVPPTEAPVRPTPSPTKSPTDRPVPAPTKAPVEPVSPTEAPVRPVPVPTKAPAEPVVPTEAPVRMPTRY